MTSLRRQKKENKKMLRVLDHPLLKQYRQTAGATTVSQIRSDATSATTKVLAHYKCPHTHSLN